MRFQYFALICNGIRGTHVHLPILTLISDLKLNTMHRCMTMWHGFTADYHDQVYDFFLLHHMTQKSTFWVQKLWKFHYFLTLKYYTAIIYPSGAHL